MMISVEKINLSRDRSTEVYLHKTDSGKFIVAIPFLHWSAEFDQNDELKDIASHLQDSLNFALYEGDKEDLANAIISMVQTYK